MKKESRKDLTLLFPPNPNHVASLISQKNIFIFIASFLIIYIRVIHSVMETDTGLQSVLAENCQHNTTYLSYLKEKK